MKCNANRHNKYAEPTLGFHIGDESTGKSCIIHLPIRFKKCFDDLNISTDKKTSDDYNLNKPIKTNNASALQKFSEIVLEFSAEQAEAFTQNALKSYPTTIADLLDIAIEAGEYKYLHAGNYYDLAKGFINYMQMADPSAEICSTPEEDYEAFGKHIVAQTDGFFFKKMFFYK